MILQVELASVNKKSIIVPERFSMPYEQHAYRQGFNCGVYGATEENCNFSLFGNRASTAAWEAGKSDGEKSLRPNSTNKIIDHFEEKK